MHLQKGREIVHPQRILDQERQAAICCCSPPVRLKSEHKAAITATQSSALLLLESGSCGSPVAEMEAAAPSRGLDSSQAQPLRPARGGGRQYLLLHGGFNGRRRKRWQQWQDSHGQLHVAYSLTAPLVPRNPRSNALNRQNLREQRLMQLLQNRSSRKATSKVGP